MADADDPWANHIRGTPLAEGTDPLATHSPAADASDHADLAGGKGKGAAATSLSGTDRSGLDGHGNESNSVTEKDPTWGPHSMQNGRAGHKGAAGEEGTHSAGSPSTAATRALSTASADGAQHGSFKDQDGARRRDTVQEVGRLVNSRTDADGERSGHGNDGGDRSEDEDEEEMFVYPGASSQQAQADIATMETAQGSSAKIQAASAPAMPSQVPEAGATAARAPTSQAAATSPPPSSAPAKPVDYARLVQLCSQGPASAVKSFFEVTCAPAPVGAGVSAFALANEPHPSSGLVPVHFAAKEGKVEILRWLIKEAGALIEMEDREGETAAHKAAMAGKLPALTFLVSSGASANCIDGDGWTPLHNACSKGYLDIVKMLIETADAPADVKGGRGGWTPLMNAASNGHLPVVRYLTSKQHVDPFLRNAAGETAYDVAAATFEIFICEVLERYERERWAALRLSSQPNDAPQSGQDHAQVLPGRGPYNPLALHSIVPIILHENQRLDTRMSTLAIRAGKPRWSGTQAGRPDKQDRRAPATMPPGPLSVSRTRNMPMSRGDIHLPTRQQPYKLRLPNRSAQIAAARRARGELAPEQEELGSTPTPESVLNARNSDSGASATAASAAGSEGARVEEPSHFWLSDWQNDFTHPQVEAEQGWQYSASFDTPDERWVATAPPPLTRLLEGRGLGQSVQRAVNNVVLASSGTASVAETEAVSSGWVRRRRWVRVMRRRLDIEIGDDLEAMEQASLNAMATTASATAGSSLLTSASIYEAQQEGRLAAQQLGPDADYLARSQSMAGTVDGETPIIGQDGDRHTDLLKKQIVRLELAVSELRQHAFSDEDYTRQQRAEDLLKRYTLRLGQLRQTIGLDEDSEEEDDDEDEEFIYPNSYKDDGQSVVTRIGGPFPTSAGVVPGRPNAPQRQSSSASAYGERATATETGSSLGAIRSADLANAREFRVPTHEVPNRPAMSANSPGADGPGTGRLREQSLLPTWESDGDATACRGCGRKFTFFVRKHHCRRCGRIYCDACSTHRAHLAPDELVIDPGVPEMLLLESSGPSRICDTCDAERRLPEGLQRNTTGALQRAVGHLDLSSVGDGHGRRAGAGTDDDAMSDVSSRASELNECPVCGRRLAAVSEDATLQEEHVRQCLDNGGGGSVQGGRYLVYKLGEGPIVGKECQICLEELLVGMTIARLPCLCYYHRHCIDAWFSRGRTCPVHARAW